MLAVDELTTGYSRAPILREVSIEVGDEIVCLLGANGAGKTTLLRALSGTLKAWSGRITLDGADLRRISPWNRVRRGVAHVPEGRHVFTAMSVRDNLRVAGLAAADSKDRREQVFALFPRLAERHAQTAGSLSGGEQQMLAISRALMTGPRVLLVDEMSAGLAPVIAQSLVEGLVAIHRQGVAILLVEQSPHLVADVVQRVYLLEQGRVVGQGSLADLGGADALAELYLGVH